MDEKQTLEMTNENLTFDALIEEVSAFLLENQDISKQKFQCIVEEALRSETDPEIKKTDRDTKAKPTGALRARWRKRKPCLSTRWCCFWLMALGLGVLVYMLISDNGQYLFVKRSTVKVANALFKMVSPVNDEIKCLNALVFYLVQRPIRRFAHQMGLLGRKEQPHCVLKNPFFEPEKEEDQCMRCVNVKHILTTKKDLTEEYHTLAAITFNPIVFRQLVGNVSVSDLRKKLEESGKLQAEVPNYVNSNTDEIKSMGDLIDPNRFDKMVKNSTVHLEWRSGNYYGRSVIKGLFPLPAIIEQNLNWDGNYYFDSYRKLFLDGAESDAYDLDVIPKPETYVIYLQGSGSRKIILSPREPCGYQCCYLSTHLKAGDVLTFPNAVWKARSEAADGEEMSLASLSLTH